MIEATDGYDGDPKLVKVFDIECHGGPDCHLSQIIERVSHPSNCALMPQK
jgi:GTP cyclohydrolase I